MMSRYTGFQSIIGGETMEICLKEIYKKDPEAISKIIDGEIVLLPLGEEVGIQDLGVFHILKNKTAIYIWQLIDGKRTVGQIKQMVLKRFQVEPQKAESDILDFFNHLKNIKAIVSL